MSFKEGDGSNEQDETRRRAPKKLYISRIPKFPWSECSQPNSALVSCHEAPLLLLLTCFLSPKDALNLGKTCRRLYDLFQKSCKNRNILVLINDTQDTALEFERLFSEASDNNNRKNKSDINHNFLNQLNLHTNSTSSTFDLSFPLIQNLFSSTFPGLTYLEIISPLALPSLPELCKTLNSSLVQLETLKLYLNSYEWMFDLNETSPETDRSFLPTGTYCQLSLPFLRHLTLALTEGNLIYYHEDLKKVKSYSPLTIHSRSLASLHLSTSDSLPRLCSLIHQYVILPRDQLGMGLGGSGNGSSWDVQIAHSLKREHKSELMSMLTSVDQAKYAHSLSFITYLRIEDNFIPPPQFALFLPFMSRLRVISFWCGETTQGASSYHYTAIICALSCLPNLHQIKVDFTGFPVHLAEGLWFPFLPVLPTVKKLELKYPFSCAADDVGTFTSQLQTDIVEQLHLDRSFPGLTHFCCQFVQKKLSSYRSYVESELAAGKALVRSLERLPVSSENREVTFVFENGGRHHLLYNSPDNSVRLTQLGKEKKLSF